MSIFPGISPTVGNSAVNPPEKKQDKGRKKKKSWRGEQRIEKGMGGKKKSFVLVQVASLTQGVRETMSHAEFRNTLKSKTASKLPDGRWCGGEAEN